MSSGSSGRGGGRLGAFPLAELLPGLPLPHTLAAEDRQATSLRHRRGQLFDQAEGGVARTLQSLRSKFIISAEPVHSGADIDELLDCD